MAVTVYKDIISDTGYEVSDAGIVATEHWIVRGLTPSSSIMYNAVNTPGIPRYGEPHRSIPNAFVFSVTPSPFGENSKDKVHIVVRYRDTSVVWSRIIGNTQRDKTKRDADGNMMIVHYKTGFDPKKAPTAANKGINQVIDMDYQRWGLTLQFEKWGIEIPGNPSSGGADPHRSMGGSIANFIGSTNDRDWQGFPADCWMCTDANAEGTIIRARPIFWHASVSFTLKVRFSKFSKNPIETWRLVGLYVNPRYRMTPPDVDPLKGGFPDNKEGNGWKEFKNFNGQDNFQARLPWIPKIIPDDFQKSP